MSNEKDSRSLEEIYRKVVWENIKLCDFYSRGNLRGSDFSGSMKDLNKEFKIFGLNEKKMHEIYHILSKQYERWLNEL